MYSSSTALLICAAALSSSTLLGQSLSVLKKADSNYWVEASAPANNPHTLQASADLRRWVDIRSGVEAGYSLQLTNAGISQRYFRLMPSTSAPPIRVLLIGDSMTADCCGWGRGIYGYFNENATVVNYATPWASTRIFLQSAELEKMLLIEPDYVLIQYGFIDGGSDENSNTTLEQFEANLRTIVQTVRGFHGVPIMITLHALRSWDENGRVKPGWQERNAVTRRVAADLKTHLIDLYQITLDLFNELGPSGTAFMEFAPGDTMHFSQAGGEYISRIIVNALPSALGPYLTTAVFDPPLRP
jgi:lysophospholipase L1-like esterase